MNIGSCSLVCFLLHELAFGIGNRGVYKSYCTMTLCIGIYITDLCAKDSKWENLSSGLGRFVAVRLSCLSMVDVRDTNTWHYLTAITEMGEEVLTSPLHFPRPECQIGGSNLNNRTTTLNNGAQMISNALVSIFLCIKWVSALTVNHIIYHHLLR